MLVSVSGNAWFSHTSARIHCLFLYFPPLPNKSIVSSSQLSRVLVCAWARPRKSTIFNKLMINSILPHYLHSYKLQVLVQKNRIVVSIRRSLEYIILKYASGLIRNINSQYLVQYRTTIPIGNAMVCMCHVYLMYIRFTHPFHQIHHCDPLF